MKGLLSIAVLAATAPPDLLFVSGNNNSYNHNNNNNIDVSSILDTSSSFATATSDSTTNNQQVAVDTPLGIVVGANSDPRFATGQNNVDAFLGIQFGTIPARFQKSHVVTTNDYTIERRHNEVQNGRTTTYIDALDFGPFCYQSIIMPWYKDQRQSEQCLYLNIWRPSGSSPSSNLSVMVFIHGGFNFEGSPQPPAWGHNLAREGNVMVISIDYRLGVFGFMATDDKGTNGMNGLDDQGKQAELRCFV